MSTVSGYRYPTIGQLPLGVAVLAVLIGILGVFILLGGAILLVLGTGVAFGSGTVTVFGSSGAIAGLILLIAGILTLAVATGLWDQELWALALAVVVLLFYGVLEFVAGAWLGLMIVVLLLIYLGAVSNHFD
ncbi:MAG: hypothetical protein L3J96_03755 [Thermoplasmata archaeon]|nr:hypothetical protein [Thermoplasmata archaeon]